MLVSIHDTPARLGLCETFSKSFQHGALPGVLPTDYNSGFNPAEEGKTTDGMILWLEMMMTMNLVFTVF